MKKILSVILFVLPGFGLLFSQTIETTGIPITEIYTDFHYSFNDTTKTTGFGLEKVLFGYNFLPGNKFSATVILNIGSPDELARGSEPRRYAFFREAFMNYSKDKLTISFGISKTHMFDYQQIFFGKRYVASPFQILNGYGYFSDLGIAIDYQFNDVFKADFSIMNGEGYSNIQMDNNLKASAGLYITPVRELAFRVFGDIIKREGLWQSTLIGFAGINNDLITLGAEINYKTNFDLIGGHHAWGFSGTGAIKFSEKAELFGRFDHSASVIPAGEGVHWNYLNDNNLLIAGLQYIFSKNVKIALDYQGTYPYISEVPATDALYLNAHFKF